MLAERQLHRLLAGLVAVAAVAVALLLSASPAVAAFPGASNGQIAFVSDRDPLGSGNIQVFVMGPDGQNPTNVSTNPDNDFAPSFSPDGKRIVFAGDPDIGNDELYVMDADGGNRVRLTRTEGDESDPVFSPDGKRIAFVSFTDGSLGDEIHLIDADGGNRVRLLFPPGSGILSHADPAWSPDGTRLAFAREGELGGGDVWVIDLVTGVQTQLTSSFELEGEPDWSPDGSRIAYVSDPFIIGATKLVSNPDIWSMSPDGSGKVRLTSSRLEERNPAYSPDGSQIAFTSRRAQDDLHVIVNYPGDIYVMNADGSNQHNITPAGSVLLEEDEPGDEEPSWQPLGPGADRVAPAFAGTVNVPAVVPILREPTRAVISQRGAGTPIRFRISERASAKLAVERIVRGRKVKRGRRVRCVATRKRVAPRQRCTLGKLRGWLVRPTKRGRNRVLFTGRIGRKPLKPGLYRIRAGAVDRTANPARQKRSRFFRVVR